MRQRTLAAGCLLAVGLVSTGCSRSAPRGVVLVSVDTLRADHLGCYGYTRRTSPWLDRTAEHGVVFLAARSHAPSTLLSHASLLTSRIPQQHGASHVRRVRVPDALVTLAEAFGSAGWRTYAITGGAQLAPEFGFDQGFERYDVLADAQDTEAAVDALVAWIDRLADGERFFAFLHTYQVHHPYRPPARFMAELDAGYAGPLPDEISVDLLREVNWGGRVLSAADRAHVVAAYDAGIRAVDAALERLDAALAVRELQDRVLLAITSDHGEELGERGRLGWHSLTLFEEMLRVPLVLRGLGVPAGRRVAESVRHLDLGPTLLAAAGIVPPSEFAGVSLLPLASTWPVRPLVAYGEIEQVPPFSAILVGSWKLYEGALYDLASDPGETTDLARREPSRVATLALQLAAAETETPATGAQASPDADQIERLRALGYAQ